MGAVEFSFSSYVANNADYSGGGVVKNTPSYSSNTIVDSLKNAVASRAVSTAVKTVLPRLNPYVAVGQIACEGVSYLRAKSSDFGHSEGWVDSGNTDLSTISISKIINSKADSDMDVTNYAQNFSDYQESSYNQLSSDLDNIDSTLKASTAPTLPETMINNTSALVQSLNALTLSFQQQLGYMSSGILSVGAYLDQLVTLKQKEFEFHQETESIKLEKTQLQKESYEFKKTAQDVYDLDGQKVASFAPREAELVKNTTVAKDTTDKINFELDDEDLEPDDSSSFVLGGFSKSSDIMSEYITAMGGSVV